MWNVLKKYTKIVLLYLRCPLRRLDEPHNEVSIFQEVFHADTFWILVQLQSFSVTFFRSEEGLAGVERSDWAILTFDALYFMIDSVHLSFKSFLDSLSVSFDENLKGLGDGGISAFNSISSLVDHDCWCSLKVTFIWWNHWDVGLRSTYSRTIQESSIDTDITKKGKTKVKIFLTAILIIATVTKHLCAVWVAWPLKCVKSAWGWLCLFRLINQLHFNHFSVHFSNFDCYFYFLLLNFWSKNLTLKRKSSLASTLVFLSLSTRVWRRRVTSKCTLF